MRAYSGRGRGNCVCIAGFAGHCAPPHDLSDVLSCARCRSRARLSARGRLETLAIIAYHQPVTRAEIEADFVASQTSKGTLDTLIETGWVAPARGAAAHQAARSPMARHRISSIISVWNRFDDLPGLEEPQRGAGFIEGPHPRPA